MMQIETPLINRLKRISPSRFYALQQCALREIWRSSGATPALPKNPSAWLGQVIHSLLERASKHEIGGLSEIEGHWESLLTEIEVEISSSPMSRHLVPLCHTAPLYEVRKLQALKLAAIMLKGKAGQASTKVNSEYWVQTTNGDVGGKIDLVVTGADGITISDFKSGTITERENHSVIKPEYQTQMKLYAALYKESTGKTPRRLLLTGIDGGSLEVAFSIGECEKLLRCAQADFVRINSIISSANASEKKRADLASPSPSACNYCEFRPVCGEYRQVYPGPESDECWPIDVYGLVKKIRTLGNGSLWVCITSDSGDKEWIVRRLDSDRHMALHASPKRIAIFSLAKDTVPNSYVENKMTTVYPL